ADADLAGPHPHGELVAEQPGGRLAGPGVGQPEVLAEERRDLDVEVVQGDDAVDPAGPHQVGGGVDEPAAVGEVADREHVGTRLPRPRLAELPLDRQQVDGAALLPAPLQEPVALEVAGECEDGEWHADTIPGVDPPGYRG